MLSSAARRDNGKCVAAHPPGPVIIEAMSDAPASSRAVRSFYAETAGGIRVCHGLSCALNGGRDVAGRVAASGATVEAVHCLGHCDRSPALLDATAHAVTGAAALAWPAALPGPEPVPTVRVAARRPVVTGRIVLGSHASLEVARRAGVYGALAAAVAGSAEAVLVAVEASGERGRGGAGFPTGRKWRAAAAHARRQPVVIANGDEGDPGSFVDRRLLEDDPHAVLEGLALCGYAVGAAEGIVFVRSEYPAARAAVTAAIAEAREAGILGPSVLGSRWAFDITVVSGRGSYVCGEETALLNAVEGRRGEVRVRPPYPVESGLHGRPTVVNNIETLVNVPWILREGPDAFRALGTAGSPGTKVLSLARGWALPGLVEVEFGVALGDVVEALAGGSRDGAPLQAIALGGPMGSIVLPGHFSVRLDHDELAAAGIRLGHGGLVPLPAGCDPARVLVDWLAFMASESCGKCIPCRHGSVQALALAQRLAASTGAAAREGAASLERLLDLVEATSLCGFGQGIPAPARQLVRLVGGRSTA